MDFKICKVSKEEYPELLEVWEASVRATHHFLKESDIQYFKPLILNQYFDAVELGSIKDNDRIIGFFGVADENLEMLFLHPEYFGRGIGQNLLQHTIEHLNITKVDVNEQNKKALNLYKRCGFVAISRSELDGTGKPYPIIHMRLRA